MKFNSIEQAVKFLKVNNVFLFVENNKLGIKKKGTYDLPDDVREYLKNNKGDIIDYLSNGSSRIKSAGDFGLPMDISNSSLYKFMNSDIHRNKKISDVYILSPLQNGFAFHHLYDQKSYVFQGGFDIKGEFSIERIRKIWVFLVQKHTILRTGFFINDLDVPVQCVYDNIELPIVEIDFTERYDSKFDDNFKNFLEEDRGKGFVLSEAPLWRLSLLNLDVDKVRIVFTSHHIMTDGWSVALLKKEFIQCWISLEEEMNFPELPLDNFGDYVRSLNMRHSSEGLKYWKEYLSAVNQPTYLPFVSDDEKRNAVFGNKKLGFSIDFDVDSYIRMNKITTTTLLQGVWSFLLSQYTGLDTVVFGNVISGRGVKSNSGGRVGMFINTIPICTTVNKEVRIVEWLKELQIGHTKGREDYGYLSLSEIENESKPKRGIFDTVMTVINYPKAESNNRLKLEIEHFEAVEFSNYAISLMAFPSNDELTLELVYNDELLSDHVIHNIKNHFLNALNSIISGAEYISEISYLSQEEISKLMVLSKGDVLSLKESSNIVDAFYNIVASHPSRLAIFFEGEGLSYAELDARSNQLANYLQNQGIKPGNLVGLLLDRSLDIIVGILGVLKAGAAYMPIDPSLPEQRVRYMLHQSRTSIILSESNYIERYTAYLPIVDVSDENIWNDSTNSIDVGLTMDDSAYCIFTSGSSGKPKGVIMSHQSVLNLVKGLEHTVYFNYKQGLNVSLLASYAFDASVQQIFGSLLLGHSLFPADDLSRKDGSAMLDFFNEHQIDVSDGTPTHLRILLNSLEGDECLSSLKGWILAGEFLDKNLVSQFYDRFGTKIDIYNFYGPTETCVDSTYYKIDPSQLNLHKTLPIGRPLPNERVYITNDLGNMVPIGVIGELCIAGLGLGRCYVGNEAMTSERFVANWVGDEDRVYRTGDLVRWLPDGNLEFYGRLDDQVKLRGHRIELLEIEHHLHSVDGITQSVVLLKRRQDDDFLVAYYEGPQKLAIKEIREQLSENLPDYMLPTFFVWMKKLPVNLSGKISKSELPDFEVDNEIRMETAMSEDEKLMAALWGDVLKISKDKIGVTTDFFEMGGHSLKLVLLANKIKKEFEVSFSLKELIQASTIRNLCIQLSLKNKGEYKSIPVAPLSEHYPLSSAQKRIFLTYEMDRNSLAYNSAGVVRLKGKLDKLLLLESFKKVIERHDSLRTSFSIIDSEPRQKVWKEVAFFIEDLGPVSNINEAILNFKTPFDLAVAPLLHVGLIELSEEEHLLLVDNHHIISDGVTQNLYLKEFLSFYKGENLPELKLQYKDYAIWEQSDEQQEKLARQKSFWVDLYAEETSKLELPTDHLRPDHISNRAGVLDFILDHETTSQLKGIALSEKTTVFVVMYSLYTILLNKLSGSSDVVVGVPIAGRNHVDLENVAGVFVNTLAMRTEIDANLGYIDYLKNVTQHVVEAFENQNYPFEELTESINLSRKSDERSLFNVMFSYMNIDKPDMELPELKIEDYNYNAGTTIADLILYADEKDGILSMQLRYALDLFDHLTIERFANSFNVLIKNIIADPTLLLRDIDILTKADRKLLLESFNSAGAIVDQHKSLVSAFVETANEKLEKIAVYHQGATLTYQELDFRSNQLASYLQSHNIGVGNLVGLMVGRSIDMIIGIIGVLKSGAGYIPIDPNLPEQRIRYMLEESRASFLFTEAFNIDNYSSFIPVMDICDSEILEYSDSSPEVLLKGDDIAYCIFTSGSSGKPKGVLMSHGSVLNLVNGLEETVYRNQKNDVRVSLLASFAFDASVQQIFGSLLLGHSLYITDEVSRKDGRALLHFYNIHQITISDGTPTHLRLLLNSVENEDELLHLKAWILAGERLKKQLVLQFHEVFGTNTNLFNFYGPTETCVDSTYFKIIPSELDKYATIPIGKPLPNERAYVTDQYGKLVLPGVIGELCIAGSGLAECYVGNQELTSKSFLRNWLEWEDCIYKTGDLVRWLPDGNLEFHGRLDDQVKLRGFRIELKEIAETITSHKGVNDTVVLLNGENEIDKKLSAYIVPNSKSAYTVKQALLNDSIVAEQSMELIEMENGVSMYFYNRSEAEVLYTEIFENKTYYKHGIKIPKNAIIVDVGANVGSFSIFSMITFDHPKVYAFEPVLPIFELLEKNTSLYEGEFLLFNVGLSDKQEEVVFDYYPNATTLSSRQSEHYNISKEVELFVSNNRKEEVGLLEKDEMGALLEDRLIKESYNCQLKSLSQLIKEEGIGHIDLLKIDAENVELDVLNGIVDEDWKKIDQVIIEVYDQDGRLDTIKELMVDHGFNVKAFQSDELQSTKFFDVYCLRKMEIAEGRVNQDYCNDVWYGAKALESSIRKSLERELPDYMIPSELILIDKLPLTNSGKLDTKALQNLAYERSKDQERPQNEQEVRLVNIWSEILKISADSIGVTTDFFELGGHSLNGIQIANSINKQFGVNLKLGEIFKYRTIRGVSELIDMSNWLEKGNDKSSTRVSKETVI